MQTGRIALLSILVAAAFAQAPAPQASDKEKALDIVVTKANQMGASGDRAGQIQLLQATLQKIQNDPILHTKDVDVMRHLARAYSDTQRYADAVRVYTIAMGKMKDECVPASPGADRCAGTAYDMGVAQMYQGDFASAVDTLRPATTLYAAVAKRAPTTIVRLMTLKLQANVQSMLAAALFRSGKKAESIAAYQLAVDEYTRIINNPESGEGLTNLAKQSRQDAQQSLDLIKKEK